MEYWYTNQWKEKRKAKNREPGFDLIALRLFGVEVFGIWIDKWAIDISILNFIVGFRIN